MRENSATTHRRHLWENCKIQSLDHGEIEDYYWETLPNIHIKPIIKGVIEHWVEFNGDAGWNDCKQQVVAMIMKTLYGRNQDTFFHSDGDLKEIFVKVLQVYEEKRSDVLPSLATSHVCPLHIQELVYRQLFIHLLLRLLSTRSTVSAAGTASSTEGVESDSNLLPDFNLNLFQKWTSALKTKTKGNLHLHSVPSPVGDIVLNYTALSSERVNEHKTD